MRTVYPKYEQEEIVRVKQVELCVFYMIFLIKHLTREII
jgi:hypothetical protein